MRLPSLLVVEVGEDAALAACVGGAAPVRTRTFPDGVVLIRYETRR
jgi:hypothetical protein